MSADARAWNVESLSLRYRLAKAVLLDDFDEAFRLIPLALGSLEVMRHELYEWPLLSTIRNDTRFTEIMAEAVVDKVGELDSDEELDS
jgi:hypothetical protein